MVVVAAAAADAEAHPMCWHRLVLGRARFSDSSRRSRSRWAQAASTATPCSAGSARTCVGRTFWCRMPLWPEWWLSTVRSRPSPRAVRRRRAPSLRGTLRFGRPVALKMPPCADWLPYIAAAARHLELPGCCHMDPSSRPQGAAKRRFETEGPTLPPAHAPSGSSSVTPPSAAANGKRPSCLSYLRYRPYVQRRTLRRLSVHTQCVHAVMHLRVRSPIDESNPQ